MRLLRSVALTAALLGASTWVCAQDYHSWQYQDRDDRGAYRQGYDQGRNDAMRGRRYHPSSDKRDYRQGYDAGFRSGGNRPEDRDHDRDGDHDDRYHGAPNSNGYGNPSQVAQQNGYRDGTNDGRNDRATGHSFRPTQDDNYKNAPGYSSSMGDRQQYKNMYRQAYQQGYQQGYNGGGGYRR